MQAVMREPILNKTSAFTADPSFRHIVGQRQSTFRMTEAMDRGHWVIANLEKGKLGEQSLTLGSLLFTVSKHALFSRTERSLFTVYVDEVQNFVAYDTDIETVLSEARKFGVSVVTANQFLGQYPDATRVAILSVGTHIFFQLSPGDAVVIAQALDGGKSLGHESQTIWKRKAEHYLQLALSVKYREHFGHERFRVLVLANSERRLHSIRKTVRAVTQKIFWFATLASVRDDFFAPVWFRPGDSQPKKLLETPP
jgi:hypothetical protein